MEKTELNEFAVAALTGATGEFESRLRAIKRLVDDLQDSIEALQGQQAGNDQVLDICTSLLMAGQAIHNEVANQRLEISQLEYQWAFLASEVVGTA